MRLVLFRKSAAVDAQGRPSLTDAEALEVLIYTVQQRVRWALAGPPAGFDGPRPLGVANGLDHSAIAGDIVGDMIRARQYEAPLHQAIRKLGGSEELRALVEGEIEAQSDPLNDGPALVSLAKSLSAQEGGTWRPCSEESTWLLKAAGHKYIRRQRLPNGRYRYWYKVTSAGLAHDGDAIHEGAAFKAKRGGKDGHFHVRKVDGDTVHVEHDETGDTIKLTREEFRQLVHAEHADAIKARADKAKRDLEAARKAGSKKQVARLEEEARKLGVGKDAAAKADDKPADQDAKAKRLAAEQEVKDAIADVKAKGERLENGDRQTKSARKAVYSLPFPAELTDGFHVYATSDQAVVHHPGVGGDNRTITYRATSAAVAGRLRAAHAGLIAAKRAEEEAQNAAAKGPQDTAAAPAPTVAPPPKIEAKPVGAAVTAAEAMQLPPGHAVRIVLRNDERTFYKTPRGEWMDAASGTVWPTEALPGLRSGKVTVESDGTDALGKLVRAGIVARKQGDRIGLSGDTFAHKDAIRAAGGRWDADFRRWTIPADKLDAVANEIGAV